MTLPPGPITSRIFSTGILGHGRRQLVGGIIN